MVAAVSRAFSRSRLRLITSFVIRFTSAAFFSAAFFSAVSFCALNLAVLGPVSSSYSCRPTFFTSTCCSSILTFAYPALISTADCSLRTMGSSSSAATSPPPPASAAQIFPTSCSAAASSPSQCSSSNGAANSSAAAFDTSTSSSTRPPAMYSSRSGSNPGRREPHTAKGSKPITSSGAVSRLHDYHQIDAALPLVYWVFILSN
mmetsp:Transcript_10546/g.18111  ORF Transcript_10546/g.18111 Transcript_10546/m.18111 type:complete len:204 (-) Transcript_10546:49-660(-)